MGYRTDESEIGWDEPAPIVLPREIPAEPEPAEVPVPEKAPEEVPVLVPA